MTDSTTRLTRRRLLAGVATAGVAGAAAGAGTMALFSDTETSTNNGVNAGTLDLSLSGAGSFNFRAALAPTQSTTGTITLANSGSIDGSVDVDVRYAENDASGNGQDVSAAQIASNLTVTTLTYGGTDLTAQVGAQPTLAALASNDQTGGETTGNDLVDLQDPGSGRDFEMELELGNVANQFQSDGITITVDFYLNQTDGQ